MLATQRQTALKKLAQIKADRFAEQIGDAGLVLAILVCPFVLGGAHPVGRLVYLLGASLAAVGVASAAALRGRTPWAPGWVIGVLVAATAIPVIQLVPLPFSPASIGGADWSALLPAWEGVLGATSWRTLSAAPRDTSLGLAVIVGHGLLALALLERMRSTESVRAALTALALVTAAMALLAFLQFGLGRGALLGLVDHPYSSFSGVQGAFANKNHFAHFALLGLGPAAWLASTRLRRGASHRDGNLAGLFTRLAWLALPALLLTAVAVSRSRGAVAAMGVSTLVAAVVLVRAGRINLRQAAAVGAVLVMVLSGVSLIGFDGVASRMDDLVKFDVETLDRKNARRAVWQANIDAFAASPVFGFGVGSHRHVYPTFIDEPFPVEFTHAESGYLQVASETGVVGLLLLTATLIAVAATLAEGVLRCADDEEHLLWAAILFGLSASVFHSLVDFVWYRPSLVGPTLVLLVAAVRLVSLRGTAPEPLRQTGAASGFCTVGVFTAAASFALILAWPSARASGASHEYLRAAAGERAMVRRLVAEDPELGDPMLAETVEQACHRITDLLRRVVEFDPNDSKARRLLASRLINEYELVSGAQSTGMTVDVIADAARNGGFATHAQRQAWLKRALGEDAELLAEARRQALAALRLCPLEADAWLCLASLSFLDPKVDGPAPLIEQAVQLRPHDGGVLYEAGRLLAMQGDVERQFELWERSLRVRGAHVTRLVLWVSHTTPAQTFTELLSPDFEALDIALQQYSRRGSRDDMAALSRYAFEAAERAERDGQEPPARLAYRWRHAARALRSIERHEEAAVAAERAVALGPHVFSARHELAVCLRQLDRYDEADAHTRWCLARRPDLNHLRVWLTESARRRTLAARERGPKSFYLSGSDTSEESDSPRVEVSTRPIVQPVHTK